jgi:hypothetical protein
VNALRLLPMVEIEKTRRPRMADFALLGEAVYRAHGHEAVAFLAYYEEKRRQGVQQTLETWPVASAAQLYLARNPTGFEGTVKELHEELQRFHVSNESWPRSPKAFADQLRRLRPALKQVGVALGIDRKPGRLGYDCKLNRIRPLEREKLPDEVHDVHQVHAAPCDELEQAADRERLEDGNSLVVEV